jgi:hypothetical protein
MKKTIVSYGRSLFVLGVLFNCAHVQAMNQVVCKRADLSDHEIILKLINEQAIADADKLVILPKPFRSNALTSAINAGRIFVATKNGEVVSYKKMFVIDDEQECNETLHDELRIIGTKPVIAGRFDAEGKFIKEHNEFEVPVDNTLFIYNGAEFTHPEHRGKGFNKQLTTAAVTTLMSTIRAELAQNNNCQNIAIVYGMVKANAGAVPGDANDHRTRVSLAGLRHVMRELNCTANAIQHARFIAYKPSFDLDGTECKPLPDDQAVAGYGNIVLASLACTSEGKDNE